MTPILKKVAQYIRNTAGNATLEHLIDDHEPIGPRVWADMEREGFAHVIDGKVALTEKGNSALDAAPF
jgi:hypothetical protein